MIISMTVATDGDWVAMANSGTAGRRLWADKTATPKDMMLLHRAPAEAADGSATFDRTRRDRDVNRMFQA